MVTEIISTPGLLADALEYFAIFLDIVGVLLIVYGSLLAFFGLINIELRHPKKFHSYEHEKRILIQKLIFGLDFFVSADLLRLVAAPSITEVLTIGAIVAIRTVLSYSLSREIHLHKE